MKKDGKNLPKLINMYIFPVERSLGFCFHSFGLTEIVKFFSVHTNMGLLLNKSRLPVPFVLLFFS